MRATINRSYDYIFLKLHVSFPLMIRLITALVRYFLCDLVLSDARKCRIYKYCYSSRLIIDLLNYIYQGEKVLGNFVAFL